MMRDRYAGPNRVLLPTQNPVFTGRATGMALWPFAMTHDRPRQWLEAICWELEYIKEERKQHPHMEKEATTSLQLRCWRVFSRPDYRWDLLCLQCVGRCWLAWNHSRLGGSGRLLAYKLSTVHRLCGGNTAACLARVPRGQGLFEERIRLETKTYLFYGACERPNPALGRCKKTYGYFQPKRRWRQTTSAAFI